MSAETVGGRPRVVIVGGGFGGLYAAKALARAPVDVTVVDRKNHHLFQPLLYQVATAGLNPSDIAIPIRRVLRDQANVRVELAEVTRIDTHAKRVELSDGAIPYDFLVLASGATHSYFGHASWEQCAPGLKSIEDALEIRGRVLRAFEEAEREADPDRQRAWLTFAVVGAGPTGVELAGALSELSRHVLRDEFRRIDPRSARIVLVEGGPRVLSSYAADLSTSARETLATMGVEVRLRAQVTAIDEAGIDLRTTEGGAFERLEARTVLWAAGVTASPLAATLGVPLDGSGRVKVLPDLSIPGEDDVFVIGDLACIVDEAGKPVPGVAPAAMQQGRHAAKVIRRRLARQSTLPFHYVDKGALATIGRAAAVAEVGNVHLHGLVAWLAWLVIHVMFLIGFRNRVLVLLEWAWAYVAFERGARVITTPWARPSS
jgi:NADH dehydrogenase